MDTLKVSDAKDVETAVRDAIGAGQPLEIIGHGSKRGIGHRMATNAVLDLSGLNAITSYEPNELIITVETGARVAEIEQLIAGSNQQFAFEPMDTSALLGTPAGDGTIGGMIAAGLAGPRRVQAGGVRDHLLGLAAVSGFGESFKSGGKVVKNVTGYDLCKLVAGSWGTLSVLTEVTLKVLPRAEDEQTLVLHGLADDTAGKAMISALNSPFEVSAAAHLPAASSAGQGAMTLVRLEGIAVSVAHRAQSLIGLLNPFGKPELIAAEQSRALWRSVRDVTCFAAGSLRGSWPVWRIVCPPASGIALGTALSKATGGEAVYDWAGGLIWLVVPASPDAGASLVRAQVRSVGGHATLIRASSAVRDAVDVFHPPDIGVAALTSRIKSAFDPSDLFNRGRLLRATPASD